MCVPLLVNNDSVTFVNIACGEDFNNLLQLVKTITTKGLNAQAYIKRAELLSGILRPVQLKSSALQIYAQCHISNITEKSMTKHACVYFTKQCSSQYCSLSTHFHFFTFKSQRKLHLFVLLLLCWRLLAWLIFRPQWKDLTFPLPIQSPSQCPSAFKTDSTTGKVLCAGKVYHSYSLGELLWIDTDLGSKSTECPLCELPSNLMLQGQTFTLGAVIAFKGGLTQDALGHYVAYCRRSPCVWEMYDDLRSGVTAVSKKINK